jgi:hypothetical protein
MRRSSSARPAQARRSCARSPSTSTWRGSPACADTLASTGTPFFVAFNRRFDPTHRALHDAIRGEIGQPEMLVLSSRDPKISPPDYVAAMPYGIFYDTMVAGFRHGALVDRRGAVEVVARTACRLSASETRTAIPIRRWSC